MPRFLEDTRIIVICTVAAMIQWPAGANSGDRDSHLSATQFIARMLGFDERDAQLIASADYSIDILSFPVLFRSFAPTLPAARSQKRRPISAWERM
jgi:hypothetical protein